jgi:protoporphyrin/coproporphyrin ferrochelatase
LTLAQGKSLEAALAAAGRPLPVYIAMRNWHPFITDVVAQMRADGITSILAICLAPQNSRTSTGLYRRALMASLEVPDALAADPAAPKMEVTFVDAWPEEPALIEAFAQRLAETYPRACDEVARAEKAAGKGTALPVLFTAHSVPERTVAATADQPADPYADQARRTAALVFAKATELLAAQQQPVPKQHLFAFQSQGVARGPNNSWLGPTVEETLNALAKANHRGVVLQPIGFLCDHVEVLYDIDIAFAETARSLNLRLFRVESLNDSPLLTAALVALVNKHLPGS